MPAYRSALDAAKAIVKEAQNRVDQQARRITPSVRDDLPASILAELDELESASRPEAETADAYRRVEPVLAAYEAKLREANDLAAQIRGARTRGEGPPVERKMVMAVIAALVGIGGATYAAYTHWQDGVAEERVAAAMGNADSHWEGLRYCLVGADPATDGPLTALRRIEAGLMISVYEGNWPHRCALRARELAKAASDAHDSTLADFALLAERELSAGLLSDPAGLWAAAKDRAPNAVLLGPVEEPPAAPPRAALDAEIAFDLPSGDLAVEAFPGEVLRIATKATPTRMCEIDPSGIRCLPVGAWKWLDFVAGPPQSRLAALASFDADVSVVQLPDPGRDDGVLTAEAGAMSGAYVGPGGEMLALVQTPLETSRAHVLLRRPGDPEQTLDFPLGKDETPALVWDELVILEHATTRTGKPKLKAARVDVAQGSVGTPVVVGSLPSVHELDEDFDPGRTWSWLSSCHTAEGRFVVVGATEPRSALKGPDATPVRIAWRDASGWGPLLEVPEPIPSDLLDRVACEGRTATWTGITNDRVRAVWRIACTPEACAVYETSQNLVPSSFAPRGEADLDAQPRAVVAVGDRILYVDVESRPSRFGSGTLETVWMRFGPIETLAVTPRVRVTDSTAIGRQIESVALVARAGRAYLLLGGEQGRAAISIDAHETRALRAIVASAPPSDGSP